MTPKRASWAALAGAALLLCPSVARGQGVTVNHDPTIECFPIGKYTLVRARFPVGVPIARSRTNFRLAEDPAGTQTSAEKPWFYIEMKSVGTTTADGLLFEGGLPKPKKELLGKRIEYYISGETVDANTGQTQEYRGEVVRDIEECKKRPLLARGASAGNYPPGFVAGAAFPVAAAVIGAGAAGGTAAIIAADGDDEPTPTTGTQPPGTNPTPTTATTQPPGLTLDCSARPNSGTAPLEVQFGAVPQGGTGVYRFDWTFDENNATSNAQNPSFTYRIPGVKNAVVRVTSPPQDPVNPRPGTFADCRRIVTVDQPDPCLTDAGPTIALTAPPAFVDDEDIPASADASDDLGVANVQFTIFDETNAGCEGGGVPVGSFTDTSAPFDTVFENFSGRCGHVTAVVTDTCGKTATDSTSFILRYIVETSPAARGAKAKGRRGAARARQVVWTSELQVDGGRGQVVVNGTAGFHPGQGRAYAVSPADKGANRIEATLVTAAGRPGTWRFEFGANSVKPGSIRVVAGEVALVTNNAVVFRLKGTPGERVVFTFERK